MSKSNVSRVKCKSCPMYPETEEGMIADSYGCLPSVSDALKWKEDTGKVWSCHENTKRTCGGIVRIMDKRGISIPEQAILITENTSIKEIYDN